MAERKPCIRCERAIDSWARICPYCNWDQAVPAPPPSAAPQQFETNYVPPEEFDLKKKAGMLGIGVLLLVVAFLVGMVINKDDAPKHAPETLEEQAAEHNAASAPKRADTPLIPTDEPGGYGSPITSAPASTATDGATNGYARTDATAASAAEYEQMAKRARAEKERMATLVDPRSLTGPAYVPRPRAPVSPNAPAARRSGVRTRPVPQYQPLPRINASGTARLRLLIGSDGRVRKVDVERALRGNTAELLAAVQSWRFKPATENGEPIAAPYSVEISFNRE
jgi:TonB family protein